MMMRGTPPQLKAIVPPRKIRLDNCVSLLQSVTTPSACTGTGICRPSSNVDVVKAIIVQTRHRMIRAVFFLSSSTLPHRYWGNRQPN